MKVVYTVFLSCFPYVLFCLAFGNDREEAQGLTHAKQVAEHYATYSAFRYFKITFQMSDFFFF